MNTADAIRACHLLFGVPLADALGILEGLDGPSLKRAYRRAARATHPDRFGALPEGERRAKAEAFILVGNAYRALQGFLGPGGATPPVSAEWDLGVSRPPGRQGRRLPEHPLRFGEFLVHAGIASRTVVAEAVAWQQGAAPRLGQIATGWRWLGTAEVETALGQRLAGERVGAALVRHGLLTPFKLRVLLRHQERVRPRLGTYFTARGLLSPERLQRYLRLHAAHNACYWFRRERVAASPKL